MKKSTLLGNVTESQIDKFLIRKISKLENIKGGSIITVDTTEF